MTSHHGAVPAAPGPLRCARRVIDGAIAGSDEPLGGVPVSALEPALDAHVAELRARFGRLLMGWALVMNLLWWPTDLLLVRDLPQGLAGMAGARLAMLGATLATLALLHRQRALGGARFLLVLCAWGAACFFCGYSMGVHRSLNGPWFQDLTPLVIAPFVVPGRLRARVPLTFTVAAAMLLGFVARAPESLRDPYLPTTAGYLLFTAGVGVAFGHAFFLLIRSNLHHRLALEKYGAELAAHRERLRSEVRDRTEELHLLSQHLEQASEAEGRRIARELHDEIGQSVSALRLLIGAARRRYARSPGAIAGNLQEIEELIASVAQGTRQVIAHLRPQLLDNQDLVAAAEWLTRSAEKRGAIPCALRVEGERPRRGAGAGAGAAPDEGLRAVQTAAFRVLQESLTNVLRHARASRAEVTLRLLPEAVELEVRDDGVGLPPEAERRRGMGLLGMRERAYSLGGELAVEAPEGGGTRVRCRLPLPPVT